MHHDEFDDTPKLVNETRQGGSRAGAPRRAGPVAESISEGVEEPASPRAEGKAAAELAAEVDWSPKAGSQAAEGEEPASPRSLKLTPPKPIATSQAQGGRPTRR
jgi:hypothetical protein